MCDDIVLSVYVMLVIGIFDIVDSFFMNLLCECVCDFVFVLVNV